MSTPDTTTLVIAGPTASGKSALAVDIAASCGGVIINADSMQVYAETPILSAQPTSEERKNIPHRLYGHVPITQRTSAALWARDALREINIAQSQNQIPILVGGSGLYLKSLIEGLSPIPEVPAETRQQVRDLYDQMGANAFHDELKKIDPTIAARLHPTDRQRCIRAREVFQATGQTLSHFQSLPKTSPAAGQSFKLLLLLPDRDALYETINKRFDRMVHHGAIDEARRVAAMNLDPTLTGAQTLGLQPLCDYLGHRLTLLEAIDQGQAQTRQYAKRQYTWFRGQILPCAQLTIVDPKNIVAATDFLLG